MTPPTTHDPFPQDSKTGDAPPITDTPTGEPTVTPLAQAVRVGNGIMSQATLWNLGRAGHSINTDRGWEVFTHDDFPKDMHDRDATHKLLAHIALLHSEASEATEEVRKMNKEKFTEELADVVIRLASLAFGLGLRLDQAIATKLLKNATREHRHGGKAI